MLLVSNKSANALRAYKPSVTFKAVPANFDPLVLFVETLLVSKFESTGSIFFMPEKTKLEKSGRIGFAALVFLELV